MNSIEDLLNSFFQSSPNTVRAAEGGLMGSPIPNTPMSGGQNPPMGGAPQQNSPMSGPTPPMGGPPQQNSPMSGNQQFGSSPTSTPPQNTFNPYMGGASSSPGTLDSYNQGDMIYAGGTPDFYKNQLDPKSPSYQGGVNIFPGPSQGAPTPPGSLGSDEAKRQYDLANAKPQSMPYQQSMPQMGGMGPDPNSGIIGLLPRQSPYAQDPLFAKQAEFKNQMQTMSSDVLSSIPEYQQLQKMQQQLQGRQPNAQETQQLQALSQQISNNSNYKQMQQQQQQMGQQLQQQYGSQLSALQDKERQYNLQQIDEQQALQRRQAFGGMGPEQFGPRPTQASDANPNQMLVYNRPAERQRGVGGGQFGQQMREPTKDEQMGLIRERANPYQTASPLMPQDQPRQKTLSPLAQKAQMRAEQRQLPAGQRAISRGAQAATQPYTPVTQKSFTPGQSPLNPAAARMPGNFAMPMPKQNNAEGLARMQQQLGLQQQLEESNVSSAGRRRLV